jgi:hypothetical protein
MTGTVRMISSNAKILENSILISNLHEIFVHPDGISIENQHSEDGHHLLSKKQGISIARGIGTNSQHGKITVVKHEESISE